MKNLSYLTDDDTYHSLSPFDDLEWCGLDDTDVNTCVHFFTETYYDHFREWWDVEVPLQVNMNASPGHSWKHIFKKKRDFYNHPSHMEWLEDFLLFSSFYNWYEPYTASLKDELTSITSIEKRKCRLFYIAGVMTDFCVKLLCRNFNAAMKDLPWCYLGYVAEYGGVQDLRDDFQFSLDEDENLVFSEDDCSKFDLGRIPRSFKIALRIRAFLAHPDLRVHNPVLAHMYRGAIKKYLIWLDGKVVVSSRGNPSGWPLTSEDNTLDHFLMKYYGIVIEKGYPIDYFLKKCRLVLVSDDGLSLVPRDCVEPRFLAEVAARFGRVWKGHPRPPNRDIVGREFCSIRFLPTGHVIARDKAFSSANFKGGLTDSQYLQKLQSLAALLAANPADLDAFVEWVGEAGWYVDKQRAQSIATGAIVDFECF